MPAIRALCRHRAPAPIAERSSHSFRATATAPPPVRDNRDRNRCSNGSLSDGRWYDRLPREHDIIEVEIFVTRREESDYGTHNIQWHDERELGQEIQPLVARLHDLKEPRAHELHDRTHVRHALPLLNDLKVATHEQGAQTERRITPVVIGLLVLI